MTVDDELCARRDTTRRAPAIGYRGFAMPPTDSELPAQTALVPAVLRHVRDRGIDARGIAERVGLDAAVADADEASITPARIGDLLEAASVALGEPSLALRLPRDLRFRRYRFAEVSARASATVRDGLSRLARYAGVLIPGVEGRLDEREVVSYRVSTPRAPRGLGRFVHEYALAFALEHARRESGRSIDVESVWFAHARPRDIAPLAHFFGTREISFGCEDSGFSISRASADCALLGGDPRLLATVDPMAEAERASLAVADTYERAVAEKIESMLPDATIERVAHALHSTARTIQRRLEDEHTRYSEVLDRVREGLARRWLMDPTRTIADVAERLGFADLASFGRAFKRWTGMPPGAFRRR
jgi:AraC-like DNA-binding protein